LCVVELDETIADRSSFDLVSNEFDVCNGSNIIELSGDVLLVHPGLNVSNPESLALLVGIDPA
jgi:hypothetical protein